MKNIFKIISIFLLIPLVFNACRDDQYDNDWKSAEPSFTLYNTTLTSNTLYPTMESNPFRLTWDNTIGTSGDFSVVYSTTSDFKTKIVLGTSKTTSYTTTIGALNTALLSAGYSPYTTKAVYMRIEVGDKVSNAISFDVKPYPTVAPVITAPAVGAEILLNGAAPDDVITTFTWSDYNNYGVNVTYLLEVSKKGANNFSTLGSVMNTKSFEATNKVLNDAVLRAGLQATVKGEVDVRVTATSKSTGGTITKVSNIVTFKVTPYTAYKFLYLIGDATAAGWSNSADNADMYPLFIDSSNPNIYYYTGYFKTGGFKILPTKGSWNEQYGYKSDGILAVNDGGAGNIPVATAGYYTLTVNTTTNTYSLVPYTGASNTYSTIGMIGSFNNWGGDLSLTQSTFDSHKWYITNVDLPTAELKFRANSGWGTNWGSTSAVSGQGTQGGDNIPVNEAANYNIYFNDLDGRYIFIKQ